MSELSHAAAANAATGDLPLVQTLRQRYAELSAKGDGRARPFELRLPNRGLFRGLEWLIARWTGAQPQQNDHEWLRRFGRKIVGRRHAA